MSASQKTQLLQYLVFLAGIFDVHAENTDMWELGAQVEDIIAIVGATPTTK